MMYKYSVSFMEYNITIYSMDTVLHAILYLVFICKPNHPYPHVLCL